MEKHAGFQWEVPMPRFSLNIDMVQKQRSTHWSDERPNFSISICNSIYQFYIILWHPCAHKGETSYSQI